MKHIVFILLGFGYGMLPAQPTYTIDSTAFGALNLEGGKTQMVFADIDQDGHNDILTVGDHGSPFVNTNQHGISVFFGNGTGTGWTLFQNGDFGYGGIAVGDVNNDRYLDVAYGIHHNYSSTDFGDQLLEVVLGNGTGMVWTPWDDSLGTNGETYGMFGTDLGDVNNDGWLDVGSGSFGCCAGTHVYINQQNGVWTQSYGYVGSNTSKYFEFGDLNHDGNLDYVNCHNAGAVYFGDGTGFFTQKQVNLPPTGNLGFADVTLDDIDSDGDDDFGFLQNNVPQVYSWDDGAQVWVNHSAGLPVSGTYYDIELADLDMDGYSDLVAQRGGTVELYKGNGGASWSLAQSFSFASMDDAKDIAVGDADHNGYPDILIWVEFYISLFTYDNRLWLFRENSVPTSLSIAMQYPKNYECIPAGSVRFVKWVSAIPGNHTSSVKIEFSTAGPAGPWSLVEDGVPNNGSYQWDVPAATSYDCFLRLTALDSVTMATTAAMNPNPFQVGVCNPALGITEQPSAPAVSAWPNPFHDGLTLFSTARNATLLLFDSRGRLVYEKQHVPSFPHTINNLVPAKGLYLVRIIPAGQPPVTVKVMAE